MTQIYSCVRQLDAGSITVRGFRARLSALNVPVPLSVEKLLTNFESHGRVDFPKFVRAFEDYFHAVTIKDASAPRPVAEESFPGKDEAASFGPGMMPLGF